MLCACLAVLALLFFILLGSNLHLLHPMAKRANKLLLMLLLRAVLQSVMSSLVCSETGYGLTMRFWWT